jgi:hypothetical protein
MFINTYYHIFIYLTPCHLMIVYFVSIIDFLNSKYFWPHILHKSA